MIRWILFSLLLISPPQRPARELITQALREIQQGYSGRASKSLLPIDAFHTLATSGGLALSINDVSVLTSSASLDGNITIQVLSQLIQK